MWGSSSQSSKQRRVPAAAAQLPSSSTSSPSLAISSKGVSGGGGNSRKGRTDRQLKSRLAVGCGCVCFLAVARYAILPLAINTDFSGGGESSLRRRRAARRKARQKSYPPPDATFNGGPVYLERIKQRSQVKFGTRVHCVGETYQRQTAWKDRSCRFDDLFCYNTTAHDFVVFEGKRDQHLADLLLQRPFHHVSSSLHRHNESNAVSLGGVNQKWGKAGIPRLKWFPRIEPLLLNNPNHANEKDELVYYALPDTTILIPFHSMNGANPGHLVWDDFLPIYTLLTMFPFIWNRHGSNGHDRGTDFDLLPIRFVLQDEEERGLWASCDLRPDKAEACRHMMNKFWPLIAGVDSPYHFASTLDSQLVAIDAKAKPLQSDLVCAQTGLAGMGPLTDHGLYKAHGWEESDYKIVHNAGRGGLLYDFRNFMLRNMNLLENDSLSSFTPNGLSSVPRPPHRIVFSQKSSDIFIRSMDFAEQIALVKAKFPDALVENYVFKNMTLVEQLTVASRASIYITLCGGGAVTAMFLPPGATVIVYYAEDGGVSNGKMNHKPALLDWDLLNAMTHVRVHWLSRNTRKTAVDDMVLLRLIRHELDIMTAMAAEEDATVANS